MWTEGFHGADRPGQRETEQTARAGTLGFHRTAVTAVVTRPSFFSMALQMVWKLGMVTSQSQLNWNFPRAGTGSPGHTGSRDYLARGIGVPVKVFLKEACILEPALVLSVCGHFLRASPCLPGQGELSSRCLNCRCSGPVREGTSSSGSGHYTDHYAWDTQATDDQCLARSSI